MPIIDVVHDRPKMTARIWTEERPMDFYLGASAALHAVEASPGHHWPACDVAVSLDYIKGMPRYGLLGAVFTPDQSGLFKVRLPNRHPWDETEEVGIPQRRPGLPLDYHAAVLRGVTGQATQAQPLPSGDFVLDIAAHDEVYSAPVVFLRVANALFSVFKMRGTLRPEDIELDLTTQHDLL